MHCRIHDVWEVETLDGQANGSLAVIVEWGEACEPWTPFLVETMTFSSADELPIWLAFRARALARRADRSTLPEPMVRAIGQVMEVDRLIEQLAPDGVDLDAVARALTAAHDHHHDH